MKHKKCSKCGKHMKPRVNTVRSLTLKHFEISPMLFFGSENKRYIIDSKGHIKEYTLKINMQ